MKELPTPYQGLTKDVIIDGNIMIENLNDANVTKEWLLEQLKTYHIENISDVFYAGLDSSRHLYVSKRNVQHETEGKYSIE